MHPKTNIPSASLVSNLGPTKRTNYKQKAIELHWTPKFHLILMYMQAKNDSNDNDHDDGLNIAFLATNYGKHLSTHWHLELRLKRG
jgi:hypothetical protein